MSYNVTQGQTITIQNLYTFAANIIAYDGTTKIATLDSDVDISLGYNNGQPINSTYTISGDVYNLAKAQSSGGVPTLSTNESGDFVGIFNIPGDAFTTGRKIFRVDNRVGADITSVTTYAESTFSASGLSEKVTQSSYSPSFDSSVTNFTPTDKQSTNLINLTSVQNYGDPIAQTFIVSKDNYPNGLFVQSVKFFFKSKPQQNVPVKVSIIRTVNGYPDGTKLDYSSVVKNTNEILTSNNPHYLDPTTYTEFMFDAPIYVQPGILYAFMLETHSSEYQVYYAQQNQTALISTSKAKPTDPDPTNSTKVGSAPYIGSLFESQNGQTWTADQTKSLMFVVDRCVFDVSKNPKIDFVVPKNLPYRKLGTNDLQYTLDPDLQHGVHHEQSLSTPSDAYNLTTTDFIPSTTSISYEYSSTLANANTPVGPFAVSPGKGGLPMANNIYLNDGLGQRILNKTSANSFVLSATMSSSDVNLSPILSDDGITLFNMRNVICSLGIQNNVISLVSGGSGYNVNTTSITISSPDYGSDQAILGMNISGGEIVNVYAINPGGGYLKTPTVTITDTNITPGTGASVLVTGETSPSGGNAYARWISKKVVLTPANESGDLRVFITAYRPFNTYINVYYKILNNNDATAFEDRQWQLMTVLNNSNVFSSTRDDFIEFEYAPGTNNQADNYVSYTSANGTTVYNTFNQFAIKIVLSTTDFTAAPVLDDMRALALPSGTGI
jgi:hypothetical protein